MTQSFCTLPDGTRLAYLDEGQGIPVLFIHGFPVDHTMWRGQWEALAGRCRVLVPDLRGFGQSDATRGTITMERFADDLAEMLCGADIRVPVVLAGLSMGGYIAMAFWKKYPGLVRAFILCDTRATADSPEAARNRLETADRVEREGSETIAEAMIARLFAPATRESQPEVIQATREIICRTNPCGIAAALRGMAERPDSSAVLSTVTVPALVVVGEDDVITPPDEVAALAGTLPSSRFATIPQAGHMAPLENPAAVHQAIAELLAALDE